MQDRRDEQGAKGARLPLREKVGYGLGDFGFNLYWANISAFLLIFYTDVMGLAAAAVGTMILVTKLVDAATDPLMGAIADRTRTRLSFTLASASPTRSKLPGPREDSTSTKTNDASMPDNEVVRESATMPRSLRASCRENLAHFHGISGWQRPLAMAAARGAPWQRVTR